MTQPQDGNAILMSGGLKALGFPVIGSVGGGKILGPPEARQQTDPKTKELKYFKDGSPSMVCIANVQTNERDPAIPNDNGKRALWIGGAMIKAVRDAVRAVDAEGLETGGEIMVQRVADAPAEPGLSPQHQFVARYTRAPSVANTALMGEPSVYPTYGQPPAGPLVAPPTQQQVQAQHVQPMIGQQPPAGNGFGQPPPVPAPMYAPTGYVAPMYAPTGYVAPAPAPTANATMGSLQGWQPPAPPAPVGVDPNMWAANWARMTAEQQQQVLAQLAMTVSTPPF